MTKVPKKKPRAKIALLPNQIAVKDVPALREELLRRQEGICPLCKTLILPEEAALDHCHSSGSIRMVLHRWCNSVLGKIENWSKRVGKTDSLSFIKNTAEYIEFAKSEVIHPTHGKPKRKVRRRKYARKNSRSTRRGNTSK